MYFQRDKDLQYTVTRKPHHAFNHCLKTQNFKKKINKYKLKVTVIETFF